MSKKRVGDLGGRLYIDLDDSSSEDADDEKKVSVEEKQEGRGSWLRNELRRQLECLHQSQPSQYCFGAISSYTKANGVKAVRLRLPLRSGAGQSWFNIIDKAIIAKLGNQPTNRDMCWLIKLPKFQPKMTEGDTRAKKKTQKDPHAGGAKMQLQVGSHQLKTAYTSTWKLHRVVHAMYNPQLFEVVGDHLIPPDVHLAHRCGHGQRGFPWEQAQDNVCINPFHVRYLYETQNYDEKWCRNGCFDACPHYDQKKPNVRCLWTWRDTGDVKRCRSTQRQVPSTGCTCARNCFELPQLERLHVDLTFAEVFPELIEKADDGDNDDDDDRKEERPKSRKRKRNGSDEE
jgi:hypothetical protein